MYIALTVGSILFFVCYLIVSIFIYKKEKGEKFNITNTFSYELFLSKRKEQFAFNVLLFIAIAFAFANNVTYTIKFYNVNAIIKCILAVLSLACFGAMSIIPLYKLKEHFAATLLMFVSTATMALMSLLSDINFYKLELNPIYFISMVVDGLVLLIALVSILNPKIMNLNLQADSENHLVRPKVIHLALFEWLTAFAIFISQISFLIVTLI